MEEECWRLENENKEKDIRINNLRNQCVHLTQKVRTLETENTTLNDNLQSKDKEIIKVKQGLAQMKVKKMFDLKLCTSVGEDEFLIRNTSFFLQTG
jgi:predicted RNase H-like nuclease (RuvC/YqgF family)